MSHSDDRPPIPGRTAQAAAPPLASSDYARLVDIALEQADAEAPLWDALDAAVDALGPDAVRHHLLSLVPAEPTRTAA